MDNSDFLQLIVEDIHTVVMATVDEKGYPVTCVIDILMTDGDELYFITAKGKSFYKRLKANGNISFSCIKGEDTMSSISATLKGMAFEIGADKLEEVFGRNPYMYKIYPTKQSMQALTVFGISDWNGEVFDLSKKPIFRKNFSQNEVQKTKRYYITDACTGCGKCISYCPTGCIDIATPYIINEQNCLHCGNCLDVCHSNAVKYE